MRQLLPFVLVTACGGSNARPDALIILNPDAAIDADIDAAVQKSTVTVGLFGGTPSLVAYRDGQGAWQTPTQGTTGSYDLQVTDDFVVLVACADSTGFMTQAWAATVGDGPQLYLYCGKNTGAQTTVAVTGHMVQAGTVSLGNTGATASSTTASWNFNLNVPTGMADLFAFDTNHMLIRRGQVLNAPTTVPMVDLTTNGASLEPVALTIDGRLAGDKLLTELGLITQNGFAQLNGSSTTLMTPPASLVLSGDYQFLYLDAQTSTSDRSAQTQFTGGETSFTLMPALTGVTFDTTGGSLSASWGTLPDYYQAQLIAYAATSQTDFSEQVATLSKSWIAKHGATHAGFDAMPPGYDASWKIDLTGPYVREMSVLSSVGSVTYSTGALEAVNGAMLPRSRTALRNAIARVAHR